MTDPISLRPARPSDAPALRRLAELDSAAVPAGQLLVAEEGGKLVAAISPDTEAVIADPFVPTSHLVVALRAQAAAPPATARGRWKRAHSPEPQPATC